MVVRRASEKDLDAIHSVLEQLLHAAQQDRANAWRRILSDPSYAAWLAESDGEVVGFLDLVTWPDVGHGKRVGLVNNLVVHERLRGHGFGARLLGEAVQHCRNEGIVELHVWTDTENAPALALYKQEGFVTRGGLFELQV